MFSHPVRRAALAAVLVAQAGACGPSVRGGMGSPRAVGTAEVPPTPSPPSWQDTLRQENLADTLVDFVQGRAVPSSFSSLSQGPELALGSVYVIRARAGKTCTSREPGDFEDARLPDFRVHTPACVVKVFPRSQRKEQTVKGGARSGLQLIVGGGQISAQSVYQLTFEDTQAVFESTSACIDLERLAHAQLPARTCAAKYIAGAVLTTITWRDFQKADATVRGSYTSLVKVGVELYGSTSGMTMTPVLSFDTIDLEAFRLVVADAEGFLQIAPPNKSLDLDELAARWTDTALAGVVNRDPEGWNVLFTSATPTP
jgi:hypothetical protein